jgi:PEP-CTERM motif
MKRGKVIMKKLLAVAAAAAAMTGTAHAAPTITYVTDPDQSFSAYFGDNPTTASFSDLFTSFTITSPGMLVGTLSTIGLTTKSHIDFALAEILGPGGSAVPFTITKSPLGGKPNAIEIGSITGAMLSPGTYTLQIDGTAFKGGTGTLAGTLDFVPTPAPEPAAWALMVLGFGAIGFAMRNKRSARYSLAYN